MRKITKFDTNQLLDILNLRAQKELSKTDAQLASAFFFQYFKRVPQEDLRGENSDDLYKLATAHLNSAKQKKRGQVQVRAYNPVNPSDTSGSAFTIVEVTSDDMAFLVDSVQMALNRLGYTIHLTIHPVIGITRDKNQTITSISGHDKGEQPESFLNFRIDQEVRDDHLQTIESQVKEALQSVVAANRDRQLMHNLALNIASTLDQTGSDVDQVMLEETAALCRWMANGNFTFLGAIQYQESDDSVSEMITERDSSLGILRPGASADPDSRLTMLPEDISKKFDVKEPLLITKSSVRSAVHRPAYMDVILIQHPDIKRAQFRQTLFLGLFSASAYNRSVADIPILRLKLTNLLKRSGLPENGHGIKVLHNIVERYPRDDLFQVTGDELFVSTMGILDLQDRQQVRLFVREDRFARFRSCLVYVPRERFNSDLRERIGRELLAAFGGAAYEFDVQFSESISARIHYLIRADSKQTAPPDLLALETRISEFARSWPEDLRRALQAQYGDQDGLEYADTWSTSFPTAYREIYSPEQAVEDIDHLSRAQKTGKLGIRFRSTRLQDRLETQLTLYSPNSSVFLSDVLPMIENMGLRALSGRPYRVVNRSGYVIFIHSFELQNSSGQVLGNENDAKDIEELLGRVWTQKSDNDGFNQLALSAKLNWNQITLLRAVYRYLKQIRFRYSQEYVIQTLAGNPNMACRIVRLFECKFDPDLKQDRDLLVNNIRSELKDGLERVTNIDEDRILSAYINLIESLLRTNYFQQHDPKHPERLSLKIDCSAVTRMPQPRPMVEIFVFSTQVEGVHLRGGRVARGGLRWSDRPEDFRTEVLGLVKAQIVKNAVIVPVGSKGGFIVRRLLDYLAEDQLNEVKTCYQTFIRGLLDLTDNYQGDDVIPPVRTLRYDDDDPYLVVAADKGTATFSDIANAVAEEYQYWLGDAFASGGKTGYDHKAMGITAKGAWESVKRLGRDLDLDTQSQPFSVVGIGDMSGDVFGNGMLLSRQIRLLAAFNHKHIFIDPSPDPENSFKERQRLFDLGQSNWDDYDPSVISAGGGVWPRTVKKIRLSETAQKALSISKNELSPEELIHEILKSPVDLLFNGGIGTYIKASYESHESVSDRANDILRVDASQLRCRMIGEGGNLGVTQFGRIEFSQRGGLCFTDAIDNSAGVDTSDHEVNIKILLNEAVKIGEISQRERNNLLSEMSDAVTALVLRDNYGQTQALSLESDKAVQLIHQHARAIRQLEENYGLNRALENLPDDQQISERIARHQGLTRPEIAVLLSHSKISIYQMLLNSNVPEDIFLSEDLKRYFPQVLSPRFDAFMRDHPLRREIIATHLTNNMINRVGPGFILRMNELTGAHPADTVRAYTACREIFRLRDCWHDIEGLDNKIRSQAQKELMHETRQLLEHATIWLLNYRPRPLDISATVEEFRDSIAQIKNGFPRVLAASNRLIQKRRVKRYLNAGTPPSIANTIAEFAALSRGLDIAELAHSEAGRLSDISTIYFDVGERIQLSWLSKKVRDLPITNHWHGLGRAALLNDLALTQKQITARILKSGSGKGKSAVRNWIAAHQADNERLAQMIQDLQKSSEFDFSMLSVAVSAANQLGTPNA